VNNTITTSKPLKLGVNLPDYEKWDVVGESIVIRIKNNGEGYKMAFSITYTMYPYKRFRKQWKQKLWFKWLKLKVWIGDLYKK
jgi:hypothetical protein